MSDNLMHNMQILQSMVAGRQIINCTHCKSDKLGCRDEEAKIFEILDSIQTPYPTNS